MTRTRFELGCLLVTAVLAAAALLFLAAGAVNLWRALTHLDWLRETIGMSRLTFLGWTLLTWLAAAYAQRARIRVRGGVA
ncbi:MAG: hypothetical protein JWO56_707 [Acidobacteria bacterium]|nr:hypothetical protein [Acidobacteriota bacterium]